MLEQAASDLVSCSGVEAATDAWGAVNAALRDDLNTPLAIACLSEPLKAMNDLLFTKAGKKVRAGRV